MNYNDSIFSNLRIFNSNVSQIYSSVSIASDTIWEQVFEFKVVEYNEILSRRKNDTLIERARMEIETKLFNDPDAKGKDPFETTQEYLIRKNRLDEKRNQLIKERIDPLQKLNVDNQELYYRGSLTNLFVDIQNWNYDADKQLWNISISDFALGEKVHLAISLPPTLAKQLWNSNNQWKFYKVNKYINDGLEYFEWLIPSLEGKPGFSILLAKGEMLGIDAEFPGGVSGWIRYINREIERNIDELQADGRSGTVVVRFIVDKEGGVSEVRALPCSEARVGNCLPPNSKLAEIAVNAIKKGPKWKPAVQNGRNVKAYRRQPVSFQLAEE
jgi:hypothetical protein